MARATPLTIPESDPRACSAGARVNALARVPFFAGLGHDRLHRIDERVGMHAMDEGTAVYLAGRPAQRLYVVATGAVKLTVASAAGDEVLLDVLGPGSFLGTLPSLGGATYAEDAWALTAGCLLSFSAAQFDAVLDEHPTVARAALAAVGARLQVTQERITRDASGSAAARVAATLLVLGERLGAVRDGRIVLDVPLAREDLASLAGCAPETVSRHLATWKRERIVDTGRRWVAIRRPDRLAEIAGVASTLSVPSES